MRRACSLVFAAVALIQSADGQKLVANYNESKVPDYDLPDPLLLAGGGRVSSVAEWEEKGRQGHGMHTHKNNMISEGRGCW